MEKNTSIGTLLRSKNSANKYSVSQLSFLGVFLPVSMED